MKIQTSKISKMSVTLILGGILISTPVFGSYRRIPSKVVSGGHQENGSTESSPRTLSRRTTTRLSKGSISKVPEQITTKELNHIGSDTPYDSFPASAPGIYEQMSESMRNQQGIQTRYLRQKELSDAKIGKLNQTVETLWKVLDQLKDAGMSEIDDLDEAANGMITFGNNQTDLNLVQLKELLNSVVPLARVLNSAFDDNKLDIDEVTLIHKTCKEFHKFTKKMNITEPIVVQEDKPQVFDLKTTFKAGDNITITSKNASAQFNVVAGKEGGEYTLKPTGEISLAFKTAMMSEDMPCFKQYLLSRKATKQKEKVILPHKEWNLIYSKGCITLNEEE